MAVLVVRPVVALLMVCLCRGQGEVRCPDNVLPFAALCLPTDLPNGLVSDLSVLQQYCRQGLFQQSVQCLTELSSACQDHREQSHLLTQLLDLAAWETSWNNLCAGLPELEEHYACWTMTSQVSAECIQNKMADFRRQATSSDDVIVSSISSSSPASTTISLLSSVSTGVRGRQNTVTLENLRIYCNTSQQILHCFQPALYEFCPLEISRLLENTYLAFQPPLCERQENVLSEDAVCETEDTTVMSSGNKVPLGLLSPFLMMILSSAYF